MLSPISWWQYIAYAAVTGLLYYTTILILYYRSTLLQFFKDNSSSRLRSNSHQDEKEREILGKALAAGNENLVSSVDLQFYENESKEDLSEAPSTNILADKGSFLSDLNESLIILKEAEGTKDEFCALFHMISSKYPVLAQSPERQSTVSVISDLISARELSFSITPEELDKIWQ